TSRHWSRWPSSYLCRPRKKAARLSQPPDGLLSESEPPSGISARVGRGRSPGSSTGDSRQTATATARSVILRPRGTLPLPRRMELMEPATVGRSAWTLCVPGSLFFGAEWLSQPASAVGGETSQAAREVECPAGGRENQPRLPL